MNGESSTNSGPLGQIFQLKCSSQSYDWGIKANQGSLVAKFIGKDDQGEEKFAEVSCRLYLGLRVGNVWLGLEMVGR